ncbi:MAG: antiterminator LoaP [Oscillospiraceae bacterium]|jgi:transcriptional antiterminator NusG|nr:antiterminator LoaP [Oscillospiraceae bacterium]
MKWYVLFVTTGFEDSVCDYITDQARRLGYEMPFRVLVPKRKLMQIRGGRREVVTKMLFPGYVFLEAGETDFFLRTLRRHSKYFKILYGGDLSAEAIPREEIEPILRLVNEKGEIDFSDVYFEGNRIRALNGPLTNFQGTIVRVNKRYGRVTIRFEVGRQVHDVDIGVRLLGIS